MERKKERKYTRNIVSQKEYENILAKARERMRSSLRQEIKDFAISVGISCGFKSTI